MSSWKCLPDMRMKGTITPNANDYAVFVFMECRMLDVYYKISIFLVRGEERLDTTSICFGARGMRL